MGKQRAMTRIVSKHEQASDEESVYEPATQTEYRGIHQERCHARERETYEVLDDKA